MLHAKVHAKKGNFRLDIELTAEPQRPLVVVGESGAGKNDLPGVIGRTSPADEREDCS